MKHVRLLVLTEDLPQASLTLAQIESFHPDPRPPIEAALVNVPGRRYRELFQQARSRLDKISKLAPLPEGLQIDDVRVVPIEELEGLEQLARRALGRGLPVRGTVAPPRRGGAPAARAGVGPGQLRRPQHRPGDAAHQDPLPGLLRRQRPAGERAPARGRGGPGQAPAVQLHGHRRPRPCDHRRPAGGCRGGPARLRAQRRRLPAPAHTAGARQRAPGTAPPDRGTPQGRRSRSAAPCAGRSTPGPRATPSAAWRPSAP